MSQLASLFDAALAVAWAGLAIGCGVVAATIGIGALAAALFSEETDMMLPKIEIWRRRTGRPSSPAGTFRVPAGAAQGALLALDEPP